MTQKKKTPLPGDFNFADFQQDAIEKLQSGQPLTGREGVLTPLIKQIIEASLDAEMTHHMNECTQSKQPNRRNGLSTKTVQTAHGALTLQTPRDRNGSFEPQLVKKRQTILNQSLDDKILSLYALGMSYQDIRNHMQDMYGTELSQGLLTQITDQLLPMITQWRNRPLESIYTVVFLDAMFFKTREQGVVVQKVVYNLLGIDQQGHKDILGFYVSDSEGAHFWLNVLNDLKARGVQDILIACIDGLNGFREAIHTAFPKTEIQLCVVHQIRQSLRYVASKDQKRFLAELKAVYQAPTREVAEQALLVLEQQWQQKYPLVIRSWRDKWDELSAYFKYSVEIRRLIYTTNPIESFHRQVRKFTKSKGAFTSENALIKLLYCAYKHIYKKWTRPIQNWAIIISQLDIYFKGRLNIQL